MPGYTKMPVDQAAQDVQHSADGSAYEQWVGIGRAAGRRLHRQPPHARVLLVHPGAAEADLAGALRRLAAGVRAAGRTGAGAGISTDRSAKGQADHRGLHVQRDAAWTVAAWLVAHAQAYGISEVRYAGYEWKACGWQYGLAAGQPSPASARPAAVLSPAEVTRADEPPYCDSSRDQE